MPGYFEITDFDRQFFDRHLSDRLPEKIFDVHVHTYLPEHVKDVPESYRYKTWAAECGQLLTCEDAHKCVEMLYPGRQYGIAGLPMVAPEGDTVGNNSYLAAKKREGKLLDAFMGVRPEWDPGETEKALIDGNFAGFKPYLTMATDGKDGESGIFSFMPHEQWEILNRHRKALMLHLPRSKRFADDDNIREMLLARDRYPEVKIIVAHLGRSYCPYFLETGLRKLGDPSGFLFDTTAVVNPEVYDLTFSEIPLENILYGSDLHILLWHGRREWDGKSYRNLCRERFTWNEDQHRPAEEEAEYTLFLYEQMRSILDAIDRHALSETQKQDIFCNNAHRVLCQ